MEVFASYGDGCVGTFVTVDAWNIILKHVAKNNNTKFWIFYFSHIYCIYVHTKGKKRKMSVVQFDVF